MRMRDTHLKEGPGSICHSRYGRAKQKELAYARDFNWTVGVVLNVTRQSFCVSSVLAHSQLVVSW